MLQSPNDMYELVNHNERNVNAPSGKVFIYVLTFNLGEAGQNVIPFYVGKAVNLKRRFSSHTQISWHLGKMGRPVRIYILGSVISSNSGTAEQDMINKLSEANYKLTNILIHNKKAKESQSRHSIASWSFEEIATYAKNMHKTQVISSWKERWINAPQRYNKIRPPESRPEKALIEKCFVQNSNFGNELANSINQKLIESYDELEGISTVTFKKSLDDADIRRALALLNTIWVYTGKKHIRGGKPYIFRLVYGARKKINAYSSEIVD